MNTEWVPLALTIFFFLAFGGLITWAGVLNLISSQQAIERSTSYILWCELRHGIWYGEKYPWA